MSNQFDFKSFNALTNNIPAGLQVFLAQQLMSNATWQYSRYNNPREEMADGILQEIKILRNHLKADAEARNRTETV
jgi:hypothetical protein